MVKKKATDVPDYGRFTEEEMHSFYRIKSSPWFWRKKAEELKYAADILIPFAMDRLDIISNCLDEDKDVDFGKLPPDLFSIVTGLLGYSLECLFKASIIRDNPNFVENGKQDEQLKNHNLLKLAGLAKIQLSQDEKNTCENLTEVMYLDFRYPVDRKATLEKCVFTFGRSIYDVSNELYEKLHATVNQIHLKDGVIKFNESTAKYNTHKKTNKVVTKK